MGLFDSVASGFFNTATTVYKTVVTPVTSAASSVYQTATQPVTQGSVQTGATQQVAVQPRPPIVTSVANEYTYPTQQAVIASGGGGSQAITTPQVTPAGQMVYVSSRASPVTPAPVIIERPVSVQAPSVTDITRMLIPGAAILGGAQIISGDRNILQNAAMDVAGIRQTALQSRETALTQRNLALQSSSAALQQKAQLQKANFESQILGFEQRKQSVQGRIREFESLGPATSIEEYNSRLDLYNSLNTEVAALNADATALNLAGVNAQRELYQGQIALLNERDQLQAEGVNLNVDIGNMGVTGLAGLSIGWEKKVNDPLSNILLTEVGKPFGMTKDDVALGLRLNRIASEGAVTYGGPTTQNLGAAYGAGFVEDLLLKPGDTVLWTGIGLATGGVTRALSPGLEAASVAARAPGASIGTRALGFGIRAAPVVMGGLFAGQVGMETAFESTATGLKVRSPGGMVSRIGGLSATEIFPMIGGGIVGYHAPEIYHTIRTADLPIGFQTKFVKTPDEGTPQKYIQVEKPVIDLSSFEPNEVKMTFERPLRSATPLEQRMVIQQYGLSLGEIEYLKTPGVTLNDLVQLRSPKPDVMVLPQESLPDLRVDWGENVLQESFVMPQTRVVPQIQLSKQNLIAALELQHFQETGALLGIGEKIRLENVIGMYLGGKSIVSEIPESISLTQTEQKQYLIPGVSVLGMSRAQTEQEQKQYPLMGLSIGAALDRVVQPDVANLQSIMSIQATDTMAATLPALAVGEITGTRLQPLQFTDLQLRLDQPMITTTTLFQPESFLQLQQQLLITELEVPPYTPPEFIFEIPPIPVPIIPGFPLPAGGGGGGGGFGMGRGGFSFDEMWETGGETDPFGIGTMNMDPMSIAGIPEKWGKRRPRKPRRR